MNAPSATDLDVRLIRRERMEAVSDLIGRVGHDYNNLFGILINAMAILREELAGQLDSENLKVFIDDAESASREGAAVMARLLACAGHQGSRLTAFDPGPVFEDLVRRAGSSKPENVRLDAALCPDPPAVRGDRERLTSVMENLLQNALEAMPEGGKLTVESTTRPRVGAAAPNPSGDADRYVALSVSDSGEGIQRDRLKRVFEPFVTTRQPAKERGFGLSLAYGYAVQCGGELDLESNPGEGTTVTLWMPVAE
ncbi:MAG: ATP-binding protein [Gammaproteobacteria bacterium]|nr:ATP-binding protein [Gammaproteobacteria bacterium]